MPEIVKSVIDKRRIGNFDRLNKSVVILFYYFLGFLGLNSQDYIFSSYPRSGSTWLRFIFLNYIDLVEQIETDVNYQSLNEIMPEFGANNLLLNWPYRSLPRIIKTHHSHYWFFNRCQGVIGLIRDPRDVMVSYYHFKKHRKRDFIGDFSEFIRDQRFGLKAWFEHFQSWHSRWNVLVRYEDLRKNTFSEIVKIFSWLKVDFQRENVKEAVRRSRLENVQTLEDNYKKTTEEQARMARSGASGQWKSYFRAGDLAYYEDLLQRYPRHDASY